MRVFAARAGCVTYRPVSGNLVCSNAFFFPWEQKKKAPSRKVPMLGRGRGCSILHNAMLLAILFNLSLRPLGDIIRHPSTLSLVPG